MRKVGLKGFLVVGLVVFLGIGLSLKENNGQSDKNSMSAVLGGEAKTRASGDVGRTVTESSGNSAIGMALSGNTTRKKLPKNSITKSEKVISEQPAVLISKPEISLDTPERLKKKKGYFCALAETTRKNCEKMQRDMEGLEACLKLGGYYTNARHCGYRP